MTDDSHDPLENADARAAEYVLGLLSDDEARAFEREMDADADLEQDVAAWRTYFVTLTDDIPEVAPPPQVLRRVEASLWGREKKAPLWKLVLPYLIGGALAALLLAFVTSDMFAPEPHLYAELQAQDQGLELLAHWAPDSQTFMLRRDAGPFPQDTSYEIWLIPAPDAAPISVGLMQPDTLTQIRVPDALVPDMVAGAVVAISLEPLGGSPTGAPTGPVLAVASLGVQS